MSAQVIPFSDDAKVLCSFCHQPREAVKKLVTGMNGNCICDQCIAKATELLKQGVQP